MIAGVSQVKCVKARRWAVPHDMRAGRDVKDLHPGSTDETGTHRFAMPAALFEHAAPRVRQAVKVYEDRPLGRQAPRGQFTLPQTPQAR